MSAYENLAPLTSNISQKESKHANVGQSPPRRYHCIKQQACFAFGHYHGHVGQAQALPGQQCSLIASELQRPPSTRNTTHNHGYGHLHLDTQRSYSAIDRISGGTHLTPVDYSSNIHLTQLIAGLAIRINYSTNFGEFSTNNLNPHDLGYSSNAIRYASPANL